MAKTGKKLQEEVKQVELTISDYSYNYDRNYYFNTKNIRNSTLVFDTFKFLDSHMEYPFDVLYKENFNSLDFMNLMYRQFIEIKNYYDTPFDYIPHLNSIPVNTIYKSHLKAMIFKWYKGYYQMNQNTQLATILKLLYIEVTNDFNHGPYNFEGGYNYFDFYCDVVDDDNQNNNTTSIIEPIKEQQPNTQPTSPQNQRKPIKWLKNSNLLAYLINELKTHDFIDEESIWAICEQIFVDKKGNPIKAETFTSMVKNYENNQTFDENGNPSTLKGKPKTHTEITELIKTLKALSKEIE